VEPIDVNAVNVVHNANPAVLTCPPVAQSLVSDTLLTAELGSRHTKLGSYVLRQSSGFGLGDIFCIHAGIVGE
jgi:hypothetical protein